MSTIVNEPLDRSLPPATQASVWPSALKWGAIAGVASSVLTLVTYNLGMMDLQPDGTAPSSLVTSVISFAIMIALIVLGLRAYRDGDNGGFLPLGRGVLWSVGFGLALGIITALFMLLFYYVLAPDYLDSMLEAQIDLLEEEGMDETQLEATESAMGMMMSPAVLAGTSLLSTAIISVIFGAIASLFMRTER